MAKYIPNHLTRVMFRFFLVPRKLGSACQPAMDSKTQKFILEDRVQKTEKTWVARPYNSPLPGGLLELLAFRREPIGPYPEGVLVGWMCFFSLLFPLLGLGLEYERYVCNLQQLFVANSNAKPVRTMCCWRNLQMDPTALRWFLGALGFTNFFFDDHHLQYDNLALGSHMVQKRPAQVKIHWRFIMGYYASFDGCFIPTLKSHAASLHYSDFSCLMKCQFRWVTQSAPEKHLGKKWRHVEPDPEKIPRQCSGSWPSGTCFWVRKHVLEQSENLTSKMLYLFP